MSDAPTVRTRVTKTIEVAIPLPCDWKTFGYWLHRAETTYESHHAGRKPEYDDAFTFTSDGEELVASFELAAREPGGGS